MDLECPPKTPQKSGDVGCSLFMEGWAGTDNKRKASCARHRVNADTLKTRRHSALHSVQRLICSTWKGGSMTTA